MGDNWDAYERGQENGIMADYNKEMDSQQEREAAKEMFFNQTVSLENFVILMIKSYGEYLPENIESNIKDILKIGLEPHELEFISELIDEVLE